MNESTNQLSPSFGKKVVELDHIQIACRLKYKLQEKSYIECSLLIAEQVGTWDCQFVFQILRNTVSRHPEVLLAQVCLLRLPLLLILDEGEACSVHVCCCCLLQMEAQQRNPVPMSLLRQGGPIKKKKIAGIPRNVRCKGAYKHRSQESQQS